MLTGEGWGLAPGQALSVMRFQDVIETHRDDDVIASLQKLESELASGMQAVGFIAYEAAQAFGFDVKAADPPGRLPLLWFGLFDPDSAIPSEMPASSNEETETVDLNLSLSPQRYSDRIRQIKEFIASGETYQVNYTLQAGAEPFRDPFHAWLRLYRSQPVPYAAWLNINGADILSLSPELFIERHGERLTTRPMKGTHRRGRFAEEDEEMARRLLSSEKDRAENIMIVDMARNDLGRICRYESIRAERLFALERYRTVFQLTGEVTGQAREDVSLVDVMNALFPAASITGAPKRRTMQIIETLEDAPRGVYCGAVGWLRSPDDYTFNVAIRTALHTRDRLTLGLGGGIVWDSDPEAEYQELMAKSAFLRSPLPDFRLFETMRLESDSTIAFLQEHIDRLDASARHWRFEFDSHECKKALLIYADRVDSRPCVLKVELHACGKMTVTHRPLTPVPQAVMIRISETPVDSENPLLHHKTSSRELYVRERERLRGSEIFETLFMNQHGHVTEGTITNVMCRFGSRWVTPPRTDGLLNGIWRKHCMHETNAIERSILWEELKQADEIHLGNSVLGTIIVNKLIE